MDREESADNGISRDNSNEPVVKRIELPIKEVISLVDLEHIIDDKPNIAEGVIKAYSNCITYEDRMNVRFEHNEEEFYVFCACQSCLDYREVILKFIVDHLNSRITWNILRRNIKKFYQPIIDNAPPKVAEIYESLIEDVKFSWLLNGIENKTKQNHLEFLWDVWLTDFVTFILFTTLLMDDDPHQLFQLMSYQVECFTRAYAEGLKEQISTVSDGQLPAETMITYVLKGYEEMCKVADNMSGFLFAFERSHLQQFSLNWTLLNKRMYQKWVYSAFASYMPECIIKLKDEVSAERYSTLVREYINFDDDMTAVNEKWKEVWTSLNNYHSSQKEQERRHRIRTINNIFETIKREVSVPFVQFVNIPDWGTHSDRQVVWQNLVAYVNERWPSIDEIRLNATVCTDSCRNCKHIMEFHTLGCRCVTCLIAGGPNMSKSAQESEKHLCSKCSFMEKIDKDGVNYISKILQKCTLDSKIPEIKEKEHVAIGNMDVVEQEEIKTEDESEYHLSWAVFKHLKDRKPYPHKTIEAKYFCSQCKRTACLLAKKFLNKEIAFALASPLMKNYQPLSMSLDELVETVSCGVLYTQKAISVLYVPSQDMIRRMHDDIVINNLGILINSAVASYFADAEFDPCPPQLEHLEVVDNDIQLPIQYLEKNMKSKKFLDFFGKTLGVSLSDEKESTVSQNFLKEAIMEEIKNIGPSVKWLKTEEELPKEPREESPAEPVEQMVEKQAVETPVESPKPKKLMGCKCCTEHLSVKEQHLKENNFNKMCYPDKECNHARINETRDRLRKKLNQLSTTKKNTKTINKNTPKSSLELIKTLNKNPPSLSTLSKEIAKLHVTTPVDTTTKAVTTKPVQEKEDKIKTVVAKECKTAITLESPNSHNNENLDEWVKDTLSFIEGSAESRKVKNSVNNKKAAKKAKQKQKKEETKRIEELEQFRSQFYDLYIKEFTSKNELRKQKIAKKRDKKRIAELESNIKKLSKAKSKIECSILELISTVKSTNPTFKFSYLPTKEQQLDILKKINPQPQSIKPVVLEEPKIYYPSAKTSEEHSRIELAFEPPPPSPDDGVDPSKRIVTIRRVNLPNVSEPQVTVTAKGPSPDKDRLLYTFINGQLVPATFMDTKTVNVLQTTLPLQAHVLPAVNEGITKKASVETSKKTALNENVAEKTKTQLKKERKRAKKLESNRENETRQSDNKVSLSEKHISIPTNRKISDKNDCDQFANHKSKATNSKMQPKNVIKTSISETDSPIRDNSRGSKKLGNVKKSKQVSQANDLILDAIVEKRDKIDVLVKVKEKNLEGKPKKVVDNGQFDNNQFKMLHLDEFSSETEESLPGDSPISQLVQSKNEEPFRNKPSKSVQQKNKNKSGQTKSETKVKLSKNNVFNIYNYKDDKSNPQSVKSNQPIPSDTSDKKSKKKMRRAAAQNGLKELANTSSNIDKTVQNVEKMAQSLQNSMQRLHLSADTTIELAKESESTASISNLNVSIMDQLNRGVQVEDLTLPPGITLTKVDPRRAEAIRAKTESIGKLSQPLHAPSSTHLSAPSIISPALLPQLGRFAPDQSGVIMVDAMRSKSSSELPAPTDGKRSRKSKRRSKKKNSSENNVKDSCTNLSAKGNEPKMITLRNPMFHGPNANNPMISMANRVPMTPLPMDQPAAIIKNENGMFTIRNPALHQAFSNGLSANYRQYTTNPYPANDMNSNLSYFSDTDSKTGAYSSGLGPGKLSAIGSEVKNAQQQKKIGCQWNRDGNMSQPNVSGITPANHSSIQQKYQQSSYYNDFEVFPSSASNRGHLFHNDDHNCDDSPPPSVTGFNSYLDGIPNNGSSKYDDMSFLRNLIPGQRLNSEVTIHNINESKFSGNNSSPHRIDITPITRLSAKSNDFSNDHHPTISSKGYPAGLGEYGENLFAPNQMLNLNELESDERDIESFKRFSYGFEPPKEKPKVNINVNDLLVNNRKSPNTRTSPYLEENLDNFVRNMNSLKISNDGIVNGAGNLPETNKGNVWW